MEIDPIVLGLIAAGFTLMPAFIITSTSFLKISVVLGLVRNAIGVQQIPPNMALYGISLIMTAYIMAPVLSSMYEEAVHVHANPLSQFPAFMESMRSGAEPLRRFLIKNSRLRQRNFFYHAAKGLWKADALSADLTEHDFVVILPAFVVSELNDAFQVGFLLYLPFLIIDLVVSNLLLALGMMMVSPVMISLPLKLFLFIMADGWTRLLHSLIVSYA